MAKRHPSLVPLSHDHHHGLALALRLRQGNEALLNDGWTHDRTEQARRVGEFYETELRPHFAAEESVLFPAITKHIPEASALIQSLLLQHQTLEQIIEQIKRASEDRLDFLLRELGIALDQHIRVEERELFPLYQSRMDSRTADELGKQLAAIRGH